MSYKKVAFRPLSPSERLGRRLVERIGSAFPPVEVQMTDGYLPGFCYENVRKRVRAQGGTACCGYLLMIWPGMFAEAMHHAVWRRPDGGLEDITSPPYAGLENYHSSWFVPDGFVLGEDDAAVPSKFIKLSRDKNVEDFLKLLIKRMAVYRNLLLRPHDSKLRSDGREGIAFDEDDQEAIRLMAEMHSLKGLADKKWQTFAAPR